MTLTSLLRLADSYAAENDKRIRDVYECGRMEAIRTLEALAREAVETRTRLAASISALLSPPPGALTWEQPVPDNVAHDGACVTVPASWGGIRVASEDARAMAVLLLEAADLSEEGK